VPDVECSKIKYITYTGYSNYPYLITSECNYVAKDCIYYFTAVFLRIYVSFKQYKMYCA